MDAKSKANFINSVAAGKMVPCPKCGTVNNSSKICATCGAELPVLKNAQSISTAFEQVKKQEEKTNTFKYTEPNTVFAEGLPEWSIEPPQMMVRRH